MAYKFYLGQLELPVTPSSLSIKTPSNNITVTLINEGEINIPRKQGLREISFEFLLPQQKYPFSNAENSQTAKLFIDTLTDAKESKEPFQFIVSRVNPRGEVLFYTNITCQIEDFEFEEDAESLGMDVKCNIMLREWKSYGTKVVKVTENQDGTKTVEKTSTRPTTNKPKSNTYTVKGGTKNDQQWVRVAQIVYGDASRYKELAKKNNASQVSAIIPVGTVVRY